MITAVQRKAEIIQVRFSTTASALVLHICSFMSLALHPLPRVRPKHSMSLRAYFLPCFTLVSIENRALTGAKKWQGSGAEITITSAEAYGVL